MEKARAITETDQRFYRLGLRRVTEGLPFADEKNPARAYTISLFFWGGGQSYSGLRMRGVLFQIFMLVLFIGIVFCALYGKDIMLLLESCGISRSETFLSAEILFLCMLAFWSYNAVDAYYAAVLSRRVPFRGVRNCILPFLCSCLVPGWGQFMNGQPLKGSLLAGFSVLSIYSLVTVPCVLLFWPRLEPSGARSLIEAIFAVMVLHAPFIPVISIVSGYDALQVSRHDAKKDMLLDRIVFAINRFRMDGWLRSFIPVMKSTLAFVLFLGLFLFFRNHDYFPVNYYSRHLEGAQAWMHVRGMTVVPDLIDRVLPPERQLQSKSGNNHNSGTQFISGTTVPEESEITISGQAGFSPLIPSEQAVRERFF